MIVLTEYGPLDVGAPADGSEWPKWVVRKMVMAFEAGWEATQERRTGRPKRCERCGRRRRKGGRR